ncbi:MAG: RNA-binding cell elongation regulator Jag/EloR [Oscillospiraceae bacterium]
MLKETVATGDTVELAYEKACRELGVPTTEAECEVLEQPVKKTFGLFGGNPAKVRAFVKETPGEKAAEYVKLILSYMGLSDVEIAITTNEDGAILNLSRDDIGFIIGHRGETLDSLQYLASLVANQGESKYYRITLDVGSFREKRKETLENLGRKMAIRSVKTGRNNVLEPMNPYERRIIHTAVQTVEGAKSWSEGTDIARHVVVGPIDGEKPRFNRNTNTAPRGNRPPARNAVQKPVSRISETAPLPFSPAPLEDMTPPPKKMEDAPLYGRIKF